ncbi:hypothetical protein IT407_00050 [Candidatus Uhrbacteria bacterium]|nr:hypothetical protein [Candidatus Uhrbacteria bacterium]
MDRPHTSDVPYAILVGNMGFEASFHRSEYKGLPQGLELSTRIQTPEGAEDILADLHGSGLPLEKRNIIRDYALVVQRQSQRKNDELDIRRTGYSLHLLPDVEDELPNAFVEEAYEFALEHGQILKHSTVSDQGAKSVNEIVWKLPAQDEGRAFVMKLIPKEKVPTPEHELRILQRANMLGLPAPRALGMMKVGEEDFLLMEFASGRSGQDIWPKLEAEGWSPEEIEAGKQEVERQLKELALAYRTYMFLDKPWYIKDTLLTMDGHKITHVFPIDFERAHAYNPDKPDKIRSTPPPPKV